MNVGWRAMGRAAVASAAALAAGAVPVGAMPERGAAMRPLVMLRFATVQTAGATARFSFTASAVQAGATLALQRRRQGSRAWRTVVTLHRDRGTATAPAGAIGAYDVRLAIIRGARIVAAQTERVLVYGTIPLSNICHAPNVQFDISPPFHCSPVTGQIGSQPFHAVVTFLAESSYSTTFPVKSLTVSPSTSCRSMHLDYGVPDAEIEGAGNPTISQTVTGDSTFHTVSTTFPGGVLQHTDYALDGGPFEIIDSYVGGSSFDVLVNGSLNCYTTNGAP